MFRLIVTSVLYHESMVYTGIFEELVSVMTEFTKVGLYSFKLSPIQ